MWKISGKPAESTIFIVPWTPSPNQVGISFYIRGWPISRSFKRDSFCCHHFPKQDQSFRNKYEPHPDWDQRVGMSRNVIYWLDFQLCRAIFVGWEFISGSGIVWWHNILIFMKYWIIFNLIFQLKCRICNLLNIKMFTSVFKIMIILFKQKKNHLFDPVVAKLFGSFETWIFPFFQFFRYNLKWNFNFLSIILILYSVWSMHYYFSFEI